MRRSPDVRPGRNGHQAPRQRPPLSWGVVFFPWVRFLRQGRPVAALVCFALQVTFYAWPAAVMWACMARPRRTGDGVDLGGEPFSPPRYRADTWGAPPGVRRDI
jgi:hypothetical protein